MRMNAKLSTAAGLLGVAAAAVAFQFSSEQSDAQAHSHERRVALLPPLVTEGADVQAADRIVITGGARAAEAADVVLVKDGAAWALEKPVQYRADAEAVEGLVKTLSALKLKERVSGSPDTYAGFGLSDDAGRHIVVSASGTPILDVVVGDGGKRGRMLRVGGREGVFAASGYSEETVEKSATGWRDKTIFELDPEEVQAITIRNESGVIELSKEEDSWAGRRGRTRPSRAISDFDGGTVADLLGAYRRVSAAGFGDRETLEAAGLEPPVASIRLTTKEAAYALDIGDVSTGTNRWAKVGDERQIFDVSSAISDWATADASAFREPSGK